MRILVTGGTGTLGRPTAAQLVAAGHSVRVLSRTAGDGQVVGDLLSGEGLPDALADVDTVVHLVNAGAREADATARLVTAAQAAGVKHLLYISIVGVDRIPFAYYRAKLASEQVIERSGIPFTILRATQFHSFVEGVLNVSKRSPVVIVLPISDQPIEVTEVAARLVDLVAAGPSGRVADIGGPEQLTLRECAALWKTARGIRRPIVALALPGKTMAAFKAGHHMTPLPGYGTLTFADYLRRASALPGG